MATYYVDPTNGNDGDDGLSWANAFLTLNGAEDEPVAANDTVYVGPGVYRELLTCDVSGGAGNPITYIADVTGENTDGVGGIVRITGSDNDQTAARANWIDVDTRTYRTFRGFTFDVVSSFGILDFGSNFTLDNCVVKEFADGSSALRRDADITDLTVTQCVFFGSNAAAIEVNRSGEGSTDFLIENNAFIGAMSYGVVLAECYDVDIRNNLFLGTYRGVRTTTDLAGGTVDVYNNIFEGIFTDALRATTLGDLVEDYNTFYSNGTDRNLVNTGGNSISYPALFNPAILYDGIKFPWWIGELSEWSQVAAITGADERTADLFGITRPVTAAKNSWGAFQFTDAERETGTTRGGSVASMRFGDAGRFQMWVKVSAVSTTISAYVYREANYAGGNPQMIIKQPGVADRTTTDAAAASQWNQLTDTFTPGSGTDYVVVELVSQNTAAAGNYDVFFDDIDVS